MTTSKFDEWTESIVEEGYDIERWSDEELIDTFIDENDGNLERVF